MRTFIQRSKPLKKKNERKKPFVFVLLMIIEYFGRFLRHWISSLTFRFSNCLSWNDGLQILQKFLTSRNIQLFKEKETWTQTDEVYIDGIKKLIVNVFKLLSVETFFFVV